MSAAMEAAKAAGAEAAVGLAGLAGAAGAVRLRGVGRAYGDVWAVRGVDLAFELGGTTVLMGPSGGGKTTILRLVLGLEKPDEGVVEGTEGLRLAAVFQEDRLCENLSVSANICLPHAGLDKPARLELRERVDGMLARVGLEGCATRTVRGLSGGMKRRVAILRAVMADFDLIAFDEPLKGLDEKTKRATMEAVRPLLAGKTVLWVTHDPDDLALLDHPHVIAL